MNARVLIGAAGLGSALLLLAALGFQFVGDLPPCPMCIWQRWPHVAAVLITAAAVLGPRRAGWLALVGGLLMLVSAGLGLFHAGVEQGWWEGPSSCVGGQVDGVSAEQLLNQIMQAPLVRCDEIVWEFLGLTMAGWNALWSLVLAGLWFAAADSARRG